MTSLSHKTSDKSDPGGIRKNATRSFANFTDYCKALSIWLEGQKVLLFTAGSYNLSPQPSTSSTSQTAFYQTMQAYASYHASQNMAGQFGGTPGTASRTSTSSTRVSGNQSPIPPPPLGGAAVAQQQQIGGPPRAAAEVDQPAQDPDMPIQGRRYQIPNPWKRIAAEVIDYLILLVVKIIFAFIINRDLSFRQIAENIDLDLRYLSQRSAAVGAAGGFRASKALGGGGGAGGADGAGGIATDINPFELVTPEIIIAELVNRIFITIFETVCLHRGLSGRLGGATPGKRLMGLKVVSCQEVYDLPGRVEVVPGANPGIFSALIRSVIKNFAMVFFFPICMTTLFFQHHRATYDIIAGTVVVQEEPPRQTRI